MIRAFSGLRGRVTFTVFAVTAALYSILGTIGLLSLAESGRTAIRERITEVLDQLEYSVRSGSDTLTISTTDGVDAAVVAVDGSTPIAPPGVVQVIRSVDVGGLRVLLVGRSSEARLGDSLRSLHRWLWVGVPLAAAVSATMAGLATRRALRPVGAITELADSIGASLTGRRVPVPNTDDEIAHLATTLNAMLDRVDDGRVAHRRFTSDAAHELRTPLMALQGELELIGKGAQQFDEPTLQRLTSLALRLGERIDDLVLLSTFDEGRPLRPEQFDLRELVAVEITELAPGAALAGASIDVTADRALVARAVRNLLANAARHCRESVSVAIEPVDGGVEVRVDDDGPGIPAHLRDDVFGRFTRLDPGRSGSDGGSGLGLAIVASVAEVHGGRVSAVASPLGGARLALWLPVAS